MNNVLTEKEKKMLHILRKDAWQKITFEKRSGEVIDVETTQKRIGKFSKKEIAEAMEKAIEERDYGSVKAVTKQGHTVQIIREDRQRI